MRNYYRGDVYYANLGEKPKGSQDCEQYGIRPVIIIQNDIGNKFSPTVIVAAVTSQVGKTKLPTHVGLDWRYIGLERQSMVMLEQIRTLDKRKLMGYIGKLSPNDTKKLNNAALVSLQLQEIENKIYEEIYEKIEQIKFKEDQFKFGVETRVQASEYFDRLTRERGVLMKDLEEYCKSKGLNHMEFLKEYEKRTSNKNNIRRAC
ncbi:type II toxin-antitoxin system PemK/MazF family toxin [Clostridium perfringens]|nr:type II toxin-antitoxin system PemK/MazF family toxin [Clostridium perfringens]